MKKIEKIDIDKFKKKIASTDSVYVIPLCIGILMDKLNDIIDYINSQEEEKQKDREEEVIV